MKITMKYDKVQAVNNSLREETEKIITETNKMLEDINLLSTCWQGTDSETFCTQVTNYLNQTKEVPKTLTELSNMLDKVMNCYYEKDSSFKQQMKGEVITDE